MANASRLQGWGARCALATVLLAGAAGCDERLRDVTGPTPDLTPTFDSINRDIFQSADLAGRTSCVTCHTTVGRQPAAGLNMAGDAHAAMVNVPSRQRPDMLLVAPGDPDNSYLIHKLEGRSGIVGLRMPRNPPYLTDGQIRVVRRWIQNGAPR